MSQFEQPLSYAPILPWHRRPLVRRRIAMFVLLTVAVVTLVWRGPWALQRANLLWVQRQCMNHPAPAEQVIYATDPTDDPFARTEERALKQPPPTYWTVYERSLPPPVSVVAGTSLSPFDSSFDCTAPAPVFLHRRSAVGKERLIVMQFGGQILGGKAHQVVCCRVIQPAGITSGPTLLWEQSLIVVGSFEWTATVRMFAGQPDASDPAHFTVPVEVDDKRKIIDGRLQSDDTVKLQLIASSAGKS
jgi:hypothetical protein